MWAGAAAIAASGSLLVGLVSAPASGAEATPSDAATSTVTPTPTPTPTVTPTPTPTPTPTATATPTQTPTSAPSATSLPAPAPTDTAAPVAVPVAAPAPLPKELGSWCLALFPPGSVAAEKKNAWALMGGKATMGDGGTYVLTEHPNWKPQAGTDTSGDRHVNSLFWALPLLYRGVHVQNQAMVDRFRTLITYWINDHQGKRGTWVDGSIYGGLRTETLLCAAQTLNDPVMAAAALRDAKTMVKPNFGARGVATGANNTDLVRQLGAIGTFCWVGDVANRDRAWANFVAVARGIVNDDGSDVEGSPGYATYIEKLLRDGERAAATCGIPSAPLPQLRGAIYNFIAQATRPDYKLAPIGDTIDKSVTKNFGVGDSVADWVRSSGTVGNPPLSVYSAYNGGYAFGRAGWRPQPGGADTFYSVRYDSTRPRTAHTHDDGGGVTIYSRGVEWITDRGPYRYDNASKLRAFVRTRAAHSAVTVGQVARRWPGHARLVKAGSDWQQGGNDVTCVRDETWKTVGVVRCVEYIRSVDAIVVVDYVNAAAAKGKKAAKRFVWERWHLTPGLSASNTATTVTLASGDQRMDIVKDGPGGWSVDVANAKSSVGWDTGSWGQKLPAAVLNHKTPIGKAASSSRVVTVFVPRGASESVPVSVGPDGVTITRGGLTITTPLPTP